MNQADKLTALRAHLAGQGVDGFIVPKADEFQGEYVPACAARLEWLTGFTGSAGNAVVLANRAMAQTDSRYEIQIAREVDSALYETTLNTQISLEGWIARHAAKGQVIGYDPKLHTPNQIKALEKTLSAAGITLKPLPDNPVDAVWPGRPAAPDGKVTLFPDAIAGRSAQEKRKDIAAKIGAAGAHAAVLTLPDSVAWLLNIRGADVPHTPVALSNAILHADGGVDWFIAADKVPATVRAHLGNDVRLRAPDELEAGLKALAAKTVMLDFRKCSLWFSQTLEMAGATVKNCEDPCILPKACKTKAEQDSIRDTHLRDGVALSKFLCWLDREGARQTITELDIADKLESFRKMDGAYREPSFDTIAGWGANGAIVHYRATPANHATVTPPGLLLLDSGGQYDGGTTDITRTITFGEPTAEMKRAFTLVLKGHIAIAALAFPEGVKGADIDILARKALWANGMDYGHGTGHGVGCYLSVHEEGGGISSASTRPFMPGMVVSNEPGYYKKGAFGIRIESLVLVEERGQLPGGKKLLGFETLSLVPIDRRVIDFDLLTHEEITWLDSYHARVEKHLAPHMDATEQKWLAEATAPLKKPDAAGPQNRRPTSPTPAP